MPSAQDFVFDDASAAVVGVADNDLVTLDAVSYTHLTLPTSDLV